MYWIDENRGHRINAVYAATCASARVTHKGATKLIADEVHDAVAQVLKELGAIFAGGNSRNRRSGKVEEKRNS